MSGQLYKWVTLLLIGLAIFVLWYVLGQKALEALELKKRKKQFIPPKISDAKTDGWEYRPRNFYLNLLWQWILMQIRQSGIKWTPKKFIYVTAACVLVAAMAAVLYLHNIPAIIPLGLFAATLPVIYLERKSLKIKNASEKVLLPALQLFITEYQASKNIEEAVKQVEMQSAGAVKSAFANLHRDLIGGRREEAFWEFAKSLQSDMAFKLAHTLNLRITKGINIEPQLLRLLVDLKTASINRKNKSTELATVKAETFVLYCSLPFMYFFAISISTNSHYIMTRTPEGRGMMNLILWALFIGWVLSMWLFRDDI